MPRAHRRDLRVQVQHRGRLKVLAERRAHCQFRKVYKSAAISRSSRSAWMQDPSAKLSVSYRSRRAVACPSLLSRGVSWRAQAPVGLSGAEGPFPGAHRSNGSRPCVAYPASTSRFIRPSLHTILLCSLSRTAARLAMFRGTEHPELDKCPTRLQDAFELTLSLVLSLYRTQTLSLAILPNKISIYNMH